MVNLLLAPTAVPFCYAVMCVHLRAVAAPIPDRRRGSLWLPAATHRGARPSRKVSVTLLHIAAGVVMFRIPACGLAAGNQMPLPGLGL